MAPVIIAIVRSVDYLFFAPGRRRRKEERQQAAARAEAAHRAQRCCTACNAEVAQGVQFCHRCGSSTFVTRGSLLDHAAAEQERKAAEREQRATFERTRKEEERARRAHHDAVRKRCRYISALRYCAPCNVALEATHKFCSTCGAATEHLPA